MTLIRFDANLRIQELSRALLKDKVASRCAILLDILYAESLDQHSLRIGEHRVGKGELRLPLALRASCIGGESVHRKPVLLDFGVVVTEMTGLLVAPS